MRKFLIIVLSTLTLISCSTGPEHALLTRFFAASRLRDLTALQEISTVVFEPTSDGVVTSFDITGVASTAGSDGEEISISAPVRLPGGRTLSKKFVVSVRRGVITAISERPAPSPVQGPASPSAPPR